ncbi:hypothetical protein BAE44_0025225 [Dichanthelium oligosanthes]|uniref:Uncharacterized protein n=1 Tax=Dichanthelium oligosanthes TaxID=888268 RepID=A0A1E5ULP5_9POAL|nr:hypothetical protein BAE44_0025225 [Dichanthelium oligosanthes]
MPALRSPVASGDAPAGDGDPDYLYFLQHIRVDGDSYVLELPANGPSPTSVLKYEAPLGSSSDAECVSDSSPGHLSANHSEEERDSSASLDARPAWHESLDDFDEDYRLFLQHTRLVDGQLILEIGGVVVNYDQPLVAGPQGEKDKQRGTETVVTSPGKEVGVGAGADKGGKVEQELGIVWPTHITRRPDSDFKRRLIKDLKKPVARKEYHRLFNMVTLRTPLMKLRQVRNEAKFYPTDKMGSSYLDHHPDLAEQIMYSGRRDGLALMRGFLFWLQVTITLLMRISSNHGLMVLKLERLLLCWTELAPTGYTLSHGRKPPIMAPPGKPYTASGAGGMSAREADGVDPDYSFFLDHVRMDGDSYALYIPSKDGVSPPLVIRYEQRQPLPGSNVGPSVTGSEGGGQGGPPPLEEEDYLGPREAPHPVPYGAAYPRAGVKRKAPDWSPRAEARSGEPAWYDSQPDIDEDYRFFLRQLDADNEGTVVFKAGNSKIPMGHEPSVDNSDAEEEDDAEEDDEDESIPASGQPWEDGVVTEEEDEKRYLRYLHLLQNAVMFVFHASEAPDPNPFCPLKKVKQEAVSEEEEEEDDEEEVEVVGEGDEEWKEEVNSVDWKEVGTGSDLQIVNIPEFEMEEVEEGEKPLNALIQAITESEPLNREASSTKQHNALIRPSYVSCSILVSANVYSQELQGVVWPPHITERPNSVFRKRLMEILIKPFKQEEYDRYVAMATKRSPVVKERRTRRSVVYYPWRHEMGKSYFDSYPDLAEQFKLQGNNYPNRLALLRGFFFWLQNVGREDQFRPWTDDFKRYRVVSIK